MRNDSYYGINFRQFSRASLPVYQQLLPQLSVNVLTGDENTQIHSCKYKKYKKTYTTAFQAISTIITDPLCFLEYTAVHSLSGMSD